MTEQLDADYTMFSDIPCDLGESALWDDRRSRLYWVDITGQRIYARDWAGGDTMALPVPEHGRIGRAAGRRRTGRRARHTSSPSATSTRAPSRSIAGDRGRPGRQPVQRRRGRPERPVLVRLDGPGRDQPSGSFYCLHPDPTVTRAFGGIICSNGPAWSPDGRTMYHVDSTRQLITRLRLRPRHRHCRAGAACSSRTRVADWYPDGVTVDAEGFVWNCKWGGGRVVRYAPDGTVDRVSGLPVPRPTRCAFVGPDLATLAVTSAPGRAGRPGPRRRPALRPGAAGRSRTREDCPRRARGLIPTRPIPARPGPGRRSRPAVSTGGLSRRRGRRSCHRWCRARGPTRPGRRPARGPELTRDSGAGAGRP